jgi:putative holliday junction resolvase
MTRFLAIDYGDARVGLAGSDDLGMLAHPLETVPREQAAERIIALITQRRTEALVVGWPRRSDGSEGPATEKVRVFMKKLEPLLPPDFPVIYSDEYGSTVAAAEQLRASGRTAKNSKHLIDQAAAVVILQSYLDRRPEALLFPPPDENDDEFDEDEAD